MRRSVEKQQGSEREREREKEVKVVETQGARGEGGRQRESAALVSPHRSSGRFCKRRAGQVRCRPSGSSPLQSNTRRAEANRCHTYTPTHTASGSSPLESNTRRAERKRTAAVSRPSGVLGVGISRNSIRKQLCLFLRK